MTGARKRRRKDKTMVEAKRPRPWGVETIRLTAKGWVVQFDSAKPGHWNGRKILIPFSVVFPPDLALDGQWRSEHKNADALVYAASSLQEGARVVTEGEIVGEEEGDTKC